MKFRKKPVVIEAVHFNGMNHVEVVQFLGDQQFEPALEGIYIKTLEGDMLAQRGDWIIKGVQGEFYPCKPDIFEKTYESTYDDNDQLVTPNDPSNNWRRMFSRYVDVVGHNEGVDFLYAYDWTEAEWDALTTLLPDLKERK